MCIMFRKTMCIQDSHHWLCAPCAHKSYLGFSVLHHAVNQLVLAADKLSTACEHAMCCRKTMCIQNSHHWLCAPCIHKVILGFQFSTLQSISLSLQWTSSAQLVSMQCGAGHHSTATGKDSMRFPGKLVLKNTWSLIGSRSAWTIVQTARPRMACKLAHRLLCCSGHLWRIAADRQEPSSNTDLLMKLSVQSGMVRRVPREPHAKPKFFVTGVS